MVNKSIKGDKEIFLSFINKLLGNWYWFILSIVITLLSAYIYLKLSVPIYLVEAKLLVSDTRKGGELGSAAMGELSGMINAKSSVENEVEVLKTTDLMAEMVINDHAFITYFENSFNEKPIEESPYILRVVSPLDSIRIFTFFNLNVTDKSFEVEHNNSVIKVILNKPFSILDVGVLEIIKNNKFRGPINGKYIIKIRPIRQAAKSFLGQFNAQVTNEKVSTIDLSFQTSLPQQGEHYLSSIINKYVQRNLEDKNIIADSTLSFISQRLGKITEELRKVEDNISGYKKNNRLTNLESQSNILLENSSQFSKTIGDLENQLQALDALEEFLSDESNPRVLPSSVVPGDVMFNELVTKYNEIILQRQRLLLANTAANPVIKNLDTQIQSLHQDIVQNIASTKRQLGSIKEGQMKRAAQMTGQISDVPTIERGFFDLARIQSIKQAQYIFLQEKWEETAIGRTATVANSKIIDTPKVKSLPLSPKGSLIYGFALVLGFLIPSIVIYLRELLNVKVQSLSDIKEYSDLPILGAVSHSEDSSQIIVTKASRSAVAEQFRAMRTNIEFSLSGGKCILLTSSMSGEGKSYVALNLAVSLALLNKKVLLMELDLRKPSITSKLGLKTGKGFSHYVVQSETTIDEIIVASGADSNVDLIQAGAIPPNPSELLVHERTVKLMAELGHRYDYILMDAPPVGLVTDAQLLSRYSDLCLYLVRQDYTYKEQLKLPNDLVNDNKIKSIQFIVNDIKTSGNYYGYGYGYGYGHGYGDYGQEGKERKWWDFFKKN